LCAQKTHFFKQQESEFLFRVSDVSEAAGAAAASSTTASATASLHSSPTRTAASSSTAGTTSSTAAAQEEQLLTSPNNVDAVAPPVPNASLTASGATLVRRTAASSTTSLGNTTTTASAARNSYPQLCAIIDRVYHGLKECGAVKVEIGETDLRYSLMMTREIRDESNVLALRLFPAYADDEITVREYEGADDRDVCVRMRVITVHSACAHCAAGEAARR
jgi:hypothetical protein